MEKFVRLRKMFNDAGVNIHIVKWSPARWPDEEIDYAFKTAKALGAGAVSDELSLDAEKKLGPFAEKHGMAIAWVDLGFRGSCRVRDLWRQKDLGTMRLRYSVEVPRHGVSLVKIAPVR